MDRSFYLGLAAAGLRMPIGTHLELHRHADARAIELDGQRLGEVVIETAKRFRTPLAVPLMDLTLEKASLLSSCGIPDAAVDSFHFSSIPSIPADFAFTPRMRASCAAIEHVAQNSSLVPVGMCIGPFSLLTKLLSDPITPVFLAGSGLTANDEPEIALLESVHKLAENVILNYLQVQIDAGARAVIVCEPAANKVYFSPNQLASSYEVFDRFVIEPMRRITDLFRRRHVDLIFHDCGELNEGMVRRFASLDASMMSLGSSRILWEDASLVPKSTVLYGNLPSKRFYSPQLTRDEVVQMAQQLTAKMREANHPFVLGTECDVLSVPGSEGEILAKVDAFMNCA